MSMISRDSTSREGRLFFGASVSASVQTSPTNVVPDAVLKLIMHEQVLEAQKIQQTQKSSASAELVSKLLDCYRPNK